MRSTSQSDGRPFRVVRVEGQDIAVHLRDFSNDGSVDSVDLSLYPTARVGSTDELSDKSLSAVQSLRRVLREQLVMRSRALMLTMNSIGNNEPQGTGRVTIDTRNKFEEVLADILDDADQFSYSDPEESEKKKPMIATAKRLIAHAMDNVALDYPREGREDVVDSNFYLAFGSIPTVDGMSIDELRSVVEELMHLLNLEGNIVRLVEENGQYWLRMNLTVPSGKALKMKIDEKDWKNVK